jgi:hypothetical protein
MLKVLPRISLLYCKIILLDDFSCCYHCIKLRTVRHLYFAECRKISDIQALRKHFGLLYLPIIWAVLSCIFIYRGLKNNISEYSKIGFALVAVTILKLYLYDVWEMDNVSRIMLYHSGRHIIKFISVSKA